MVNLNRFRYLRQQEFSADEPNVFKFSSSFNFCFRIFSSFVMGDHLQHFFQFYSLNVTFKSLCQDGYL